VARMPKYEKIRNRRERAFQDKLLTIPKRSRIGIVINSAFFIWCISALFLTLGGGYVTNHQQCMREADQIIERKKLISQEGAGRRLAFSIALESPTAPRQLPSMPTSAGSVAPELAKMSYVDVQLELSKLVGRIEYEKLPDTSISNAEQAWSDFNSEQVDQRYDEAKNSLGMKAAKIDPNLDFKLNKLSAQLLARFADFMNDIDTYAYYFQPDCTALKTLGVALGYKPQIVLASVSPIFNSDAVRTSLDEDVQGFNKMKSEFLELNKAKSSSK
jgi:hypothetical protein